MANSWPTTSPSPKNIAGMTGKMNQSMNSNMKGGKK